MQKDISWIKLKLISDLVLIVRIYKNINNWISIKPLVLKDKREKNGKTTTENLLRTKSLYLLPCICKNI